MSLEQRNLVLPWLAGYVCDIVGSYCPAFLLGLAANLVNFAIIGSLILGSRRGCPVSLTT